MPLFDQELVVDDGYYLICSEERMAEDNVRVLREWVLDTFSSEVELARSIC